MFYKRILFLSHHTIVDYVFYGYITLEINSKVHVHIFWSKYKCLSGYTFPIECLQYFFLGILGVYVGVFRNEMIYQCFEHQYSNRAPLYPLLFCLLSTVTNKITINTTPLY